MHAHTKVFFANSSCLLQQLTHHCSCACKPPSVPVISTPNVVKSLQCRSPTWHTWGSAAHAMAQMRPHGPNCTSKPLLLMLRRCCYCRCSPTVQTVLSAFLPITLLAAMFPNRMRCAAYELPASTLYSQQQQQYFTPATARIKRQQALQQQQLYGLLANARGAISVALSRLGEELAIALRGLYLMALFTPIIAAAPLVFYAGVGRQAWMQLLRWTLEQAGPAFIK